MLKALVISTGLILLPFTDVGDRYKPSVQVLVSEGITQGIADTQFGIQQQVKRGDAAIMLHRVLDLKSTSFEQKYSDVNTRQAPYIYNLWRENVIDEEILFRPDDAVTRRELAMWTYNALAQKTERMSWIDWHKEAGIITGDHRGMRWEDTVTRGEYAIILNRVMKIVEKN